MFGHNFADHNLIWTYGYNPAGQVASSTRDNDAYAWTGHYAVDRAYLTDGLNRYTAAGPPANPGQGANFTYDANGNLTSDGSRTYTYDVENRLVGASGGVQLGYDPLGRLAWTTGSPNFTRFLYDPGSGSGAGADALVAEYDYGGNLLRRYVHGGRVDEPFLWYEGTAVAHANLRLLFADRQGSIVAVTDYWGNGIAVNRYDEYGIPAATNSGRFQYTGQIWLPELGMYHYKARVYSPYLGRFLQTDRVGYDDQFNLYAYVGNDPVNAADPSGTYKCERRDCSEIEVARREIRQARSNLRDTTGTRMESRASQILGGLLETLGTPNDGNGLTVGFGNAGGDFGEFHPESNTIMLDREAINRDPRASVAGTLGHELTHARDKQLGIPYRQFASELAADASEAMIDGGLGRRGFNYRPGISGDDLARNLKRGVMRYCRLGGPFRIQCENEIDAIYPRVRAFGRGGR